MASSIYEYPTPCLGGYVEAKKLFLTFPHWGIQSIDTKSSSILSTWNRPTKDHVFTSPITYSNDNKWLISGVYNMQSSKASLALWNTHDLDTKNKLIPFKLNRKNKETVIRIFHSKICHHYFILVTSLSNIIIFNPNTKTFDYKSNNNESIANNNKLNNAKLHDAINASGTSTTTHISFMYHSHIVITPISFNTESNELRVEESRTLSLQKRLQFDDDSKQSEDIIDYDWCLDTNHLLLLTSNGMIECLDYGGKQRKNSTVKKYSVKYKIDITKHLDVSVMNGWNKRHLKKNNLLFSKSDSMLLSFIRLKFIEASQFIMVGPCIEDHNTLKLWMFHTEHGNLRDTLTLMPQNANSNLLMVAPMICVKNVQLIDIYVVTSKQVLFVRVPCSGQSLLDFIENCMKNENKMEVDEESHGTDGIALALNNVCRVKRFVNKKDWKDCRVFLKELRESKTKIEGSSFNLMLDALIENKQWHLMKNYFVLVKDYNETNLLYFLSLLINNLESDNKNGALLDCLNTVLSSQINDIFMKRCIRILPQCQVERLMKYICDNINVLDGAVVVLWFNILLDAHLATLAFSNDIDLYKNYILKIKQYLNNYDTQIKTMMDIQANIHYILNEMKIEHDNKNSNNPKNKHSSKMAHGIGGGAFQYNSKIEQNPNDPNLYKDYVVEYIKL